MPKRLRKLRQQCDLLARKPTGSGHRFAPLRAKSGCEQSQQASSLFDRLIGKRQQPVRRAAKQRDEVAE
jgi:hypothetical protein